jgi:hypothetical protein
MTSFVCHLGAFDAGESHRYSQHRQAIRAATRQIKELSDGYALQLPGTPDAFLNAAQWILLEHRCCPFLNLKVELTSENEVWLSITGPDGIKQFLGETLSSRTPQRLPGA